MVAPRELTKNEATVANLLMVLGLTLDRPLFGWSLGLELAARSPELAMGIHRIMRKMASDAGVVGAEGGDVDALAETIIKKIHLEPEEQPV